MTTPHVPHGCLRDPPPSHLVSVSDLADVLWREAVSGHRSPSHLVSVSDLADVLWREAVSEHVSRRYPTIVKSDTDLGAALAMGESCF